MVLGLRNVRLSTTIIVAAAVIIITLVFLPLTASTNTNYALLQSKSVFAQLEEEEGDDVVVAQAEENATTATTTTTSEATNETTNTTTAAASPARNNYNMSRVKFLFIQAAQSGSVSEVNATTSTLVLSNVTDKTIMFSDRPNRIVSYEDTTNFIGNWSTGPDSFAVDPPNAVLVLDDEVEQREDFAIIELFNPEYDSVADTLRYDITAENATTTTATTTSSSINLPSEFGQSILVIDERDEEVVLDLPERLPKTVVSSPIQE